MEGNRLVGGLWCTDVLAGLSDYLDGELAAATVTQVEEHLRGCPNCERFGLDMAALLKRISELRPEVSADLLPSIIERCRLTREPSDTT